MNKAITTIITLLIIIVFLLGYCIITIPKEVENGNTCVLVHNYALVTESNPSGMGSERDLNDAVYEDLTSPKIYTVIDIKTGERTIRPYTMHLVRGL